MDSLIKSENDRRGTLILDLSFEGEESEKMLMSSYGLTG